MKEDKKRENTVEDIDLGTFFESATSNKLYVNSLNLHEIKNEILQDYTGDFELNGKMIIGHIENNTNYRLKVLITCKKLSNIMDITVIFLQVVTVL